MKVRFKSDQHVYDADGSISQSFEAGEVADLPPASARRWLRRDAAEEVPQQTRVGKPADPAERPSPVDSGKSRASGQSRPSSASEADPASESETSNSSETTEPSPSTTRTKSRRGRKSSTQQTRSGGGSTPKPEGTTD